MAVTPLVARRPFGAQIRRGGNGSPLDRTFRGHRIDRRTGRTGGGWKQRNDGGAAMEDVVTWVAAGALAAIIVVLLVQ
jgi:hypothetical protein